MPKKIEITNPLSNQTRFTTFASAETYVRRGLAEWRGPRRIEFHRRNHDHREASAQRAFLPGYDRAAGVMLRREEAPNIPFVGNIDALFVQAR